MNKMFTAVAILQLVEAGKVALTAPLDEYLAHNRLALVGLGNDRVTGR